MTPSARLSAKMLLRQLKPRHLNQAELELVAKAADTLVAEVKHLWSRYGLTSADISGEHPDCSSAVQFIGNGKVVNVLVAPDGRIGLLSDGVTSELPLVYDLDEGRYYAEPIVQRDQIVRYPDAEPALVLALLLRLGFPVKTLQLSSLAESLPAR